MPAAHTRKAFIALLKIHGKDFLFGGVSGRVLTGRISEFDFEVHVKPGEQHAFTLKALRDTWGGSLPKEGSYLTHADTGRSYRVAGAPDDGISETVMFALVS